MKSSETNTHSLNRGSKVNIFTYDQPQIIQEEEMSVSGVCRFADHIYSFCYDFCVVLKLINGTDKFFAPDEEEQNEAAEYKSV